MESVRATWQVSPLWYGLRALPLPAHFGRAGKPAPLQAANTSAEVFQPPNGGAASKGDQSPFEDPPALRGGFTGDSFGLGNTIRKDGYKNANGSFPPGKSPGMGKAVCER